MGFADDVGKFERKALENARKAKGHISNRLFTAVVKDTPVLEGTLRSNWQASPDNPIDGEIDSVVSEAMTLQNIEKTCLTIPLGKDLWLTNNLPYAWPIEYLGHSSIKAPQGMVRRNVARLSTIASAVAREIRNGTI